jgi:hypothetical protein
MSVSNRAMTGDPAKAALHAAIVKWTDGGDAGTARKIVAELRDLGFIIVPSPHSKPARRGRERAEAEARKRIAAADPWIGKSHSANLCGG